MADPTSIPAMDAEIDAKYLTAMNHSQLTGMSLEDSFDFQDMIHADVGKLKAAPQTQKQMMAYNPNADTRTDPFTGVTAKEYAGILKPAADTARSWGYSAAAGAGMQTAAFMKNLDLTVDYIARNTGMEKGGLFRQAHELALDRGEFYKSRAKELGITPIAEFFTELAGGLVPGIEDFVMDLPGLFPLHGSRAAEKAAVQGDSEFVGFFKGSMERGLMGQLFKAAHELSRPLRSAVTGGLFEEQARAEGQTDPTELAKSFLTGGIFGAVGGPGKIRMRDVVNEIHNLTPEIAPSEGGPGGGILGSERGSTGGEPPPKAGRRDMTEKAIAVRKAIEQAYVDGKLDKSARSADQITEMALQAGRDWDAANPPERTSYKPALRVDGEVFEANVEEKIHGQIWSRIPSEKLENATDIESGYTDPKGGFVLTPPEGAEIFRGSVQPEEGKVEPGASSIEKQAKASDQPGDLGNDLTPAEEAALIATVTGGKPDLEAIKTRSPELMKLVEETRKALTPVRITAIKSRIRAATGQRKVQDILEVKEMDALNDQIRFAAKQAKVANKAGEVNGWNDAVLKLGIAAARAKEAKEQRGAISSMIKDLKGVDTSSMMDKPRQEVEALLGGLDFTRLSEKKRLSLTATQDYLSRNPDVELPDYVLDNLSRLQKKPIRDLTFDELDSLHKAVMNLSAQSKFGQNIWDGIKERRYEEVLTSSISELRDPGVVVGDLVSTQPSLWNDTFTVAKWIKTTLGLRQDSFDLIVETLAGQNTTPHRVLYRMIKRGDPTGVIPGKGVIGQRGYVQATQNTFFADLKAAGFDFKKAGDVDKWLNERVTVKGTDKTWELSRGERMALYRHSLNEDNLRAVLESGIAFKRPPESAAKNGIHPDTVIPVSEGDLQAIISSLSAEERVFAGTPVDNLFKRQGVDLDDTFYALNKYRTPMQENYYPKEVVPFTQKGFNLETAEGQEAFRQFTARVGIDKSMLIERVGSTRPIYLNDLMGDITRSVNHAAAYIHLEGPLRNASHLLYSPEFRDAINKRYGAETWTELEKGLKDIAGNYRQWTETEQGLIGLKTKAVSNIISLNPWIWINQPAGLMFYNTYVEMNYLMRGLMAVSTPRKSAEALAHVRSLSPELVDRFQTGYDRDVAAAYQQSRERQYYGGGHTLSEKGLMPTKWADATGVVPGHLAAEFKALDEFQTGELSKPLRDALDIQDPGVIATWTPEMKVQKAAEFADWVTERTQAQAVPEHRSPLSRGTALEQVFTSFSSQLNTMLNMTRRTYREYKRTGDPEDKAAMVKAWSQVFILNSLAMMGINAVQDKLYDRESKGFFQTFLLDNPASMIMFVRELEAAASSHFFEGGRGYDTKYPVQRTGEVFVEAFKDLHNILTSKDEAVVHKSWVGVLNKGMELAAIWRGLPWHTPIRIGQALTGNNPPPPKRHEPDPIDILLSE